MMRKLLTGLAMCVVVAGLAAIVPAAAQAAPYCEITWGSLAKGASSTVVPDPRTPGSLTNVRAGRHGCFDRLVMDVDGSAAGSVRYVAAVTTDGRGDVVNLRGGAFLEIVLRNPAYDINYHPTFTPANPSELVTTPIPTYITPSPTSRSSTPFTAPPTRHVSGIALTDQSPARA